MSLARYSILVAVVALASLVLTLTAGGRVLDVHGRLAVLFGAGIAILNTLAAYALARWSEGRPLSVFMRAVLGGMTLRMAFMLAALVVGVLALGLPQLPLALALLAHFALFLAIELLILHRRTPAGAIR